MKRVGIYFDRVCLATSHPFLMRSRKLGGRLRRIVREGLPLPILAVAEILYRDEKTDEHRSRVSNKCLRLSWMLMTRFPKKYSFRATEYLPLLLKACFLYMGVFCQEGRRVPLSKLEGLQNAGDFLKGSNRMS